MYVAMKMIGTTKTMAIQIPKVLVSEVPYPITRETSPKEAIIKAEVLKEAYQP